MLTWKNLFSGYFNTESYKFHLLWHDVTGFDNDIKMGVSCNVRDTFALVFYWMTHCSAWLSRAIYVTVENCLPNNKREILGNTRTKLVSLLFLQDGAGGKILKINFFGLLQRKYVSHSFRLFLYCLSYHIYVPLYILSYIVKLDSLTQHIRNS